MEEIDDFSFQLTSDFLGYVSARDKTNVNQSVLVRGSQNVYRKLSGTIANRFGLQRRGVPDPTLAGVKSSFEWATTFGKTYPLRVANNKLQVEVNLVWYDLLLTSTLLNPAVSLTRLVFDSWFEAIEGKDRLIFVRGSNDLLHWSGGMATVLSTIATTITKTGTTSWQAEGFASNLAAEKKLIINGVEYTYTGGQDTTTLTGVTPDPSGITSQTIVTVDSYSETNQNASRDLPRFGSADQDCGQSFMPTQDTTLTSAKFYLRKHGSPTGTAVAKLYATTGMHNNYYPTGSALVTSSAVDVSILTSSFALTTFNFSAYPLSSGVIYMIVVEYTTGTVSNSLEVGVDNQNSSHFGNAATSIDGSTWTVQTFDVCFYVLGTIPTMAIQSVMNQAALDPTDPLTITADFLKVIQNQVVVASYTSRILYISANETVGSVLGMTNFTDSGSHVTGDPDFAVVDSPPTGLAIKNGNLWVSAGTSDWYELTLNFPLPVSYAGGSGAVFVITKVDKKPGSGLTAALAHEFIDSWGDDIVYLSQDNQLRTIGTFRNLFNIRYPSLSQDVHDELEEDDFTGGHLRAVGDFIYITAPLSGRHYLYQTLERIDDQGNITVKKLWQPPQIAGLSRIAIISGTVYGHSNANPQLYKIWDTNQWHDDSPSGESLGYTSVLRLGYGHLISKKEARRQGMATFNKAYFEGYLAYGSNLYGNVYFDYQGSSNIEALVINSIDSPPIFFVGGTEIALGLASLGDNPLGDGLIREPNDQSLLPKFRTICDINPTDCFEWQQEIYSVDPDSRWEILATGVNAALSDSQAPFIRK